MTADGPGDNGSVLWIRRGGNQTMRLLRSARLPNIATHPAPIRSECRRRCPGYIQDTPLCWFNYEAVAFLVTLFSVHNPKRRQSIADPENVISSNAVRTNFAYRRDTSRWIAVARSTPSNPIGKKFDSVLHRCLGGYFRWPVMSARKTCLQNEIRSLCVAKELHLETA